MLAHLKNEIAAAAETILRKSDRNSEIALYVDNSTLRPDHPFDVRMLAQALAKDENYLALEKKLSTQLENCEGRDYVVNKLKAYSLNTGSALTDTDMAVVLNALHHTNPSKPKEKCPFLHR